MSIGIAGVALRRLRGIRRVGLSTGAYVTRGGELAGGSTALMRQQQQHTRHHLHSSQSHPLSSSPEYPVNTSKSS